MKSAFNITAAIAVALLAAFFNAAHAQTKDSLQPLSSAAFIKAYGRLNNALYHVKQERKITVAFLGGSITNMEGWRGKVCDYLRQQYPQTRFTFINAGIPSLGSLPHAFRLQQDVLDKGPIDLLFVESAVNDHVNGTPALIQRRALEGIVRHTLKANPFTDIVFMAFVDEDKIADYQASRVPAEVQVHEAIAREYHLPFINLAAEITQRIAHGEFTWKNDFKNLHPSAFGHQLYCNSICYLLNEMFAGAAPAEPVKHRLPQAADPLCYEQGHYASLADAVQLNHFTPVASWSPADSVATRPGFVHVPMLVATEPGAAASFPFTGTAAGISIISGPDAGMLQYSIDGGEAQTIDLYTQWSGGLHLPWYLLLADGLANTKHVLHIRVAETHNPQSKGNACRIVHFLVNGR